MASDGLLRAMMAVGPQRILTRPKPDCLDKRVLRLWVVLPYHPIWCDRLGRTIRSFASDPLMAGLIRNVRPFSNFDRVVVSCSWKNFLPPHGEILANLS